MNSESISIPASKHYADQIAQMLPPPQNEDWLRFNAAAQHFDKVDWERSADLAKRHMSKKNACFTNCALIASTEPQLNYCEGFATSIIPTEHAWLVDENGVVLDPTWVLLDRRYEPDYLGVVIPVEIVILHRSSKIYFVPAWVRYLRRLNGHKETNAKRTRNAKNRQRNISADEPTAVRRHGRAAAKASKVRVGH